jgi:hypothetical protein
VPIPTAHGQVGLPLSPPKMQSNRVSQQTMRAEKSSEDMLIEGTKKKEKPLTSNADDKEEDKHSEQGDEDAEES